MRFWREPGHRRNNARPGRVMNSTSAVLTRIQAVSAPFIFESPANAQNHQAGASRCPRRVLPRKNGSESTACREATGTVSLLRRPNWRWTAKENSRSRSWLGRSASPSRTYERGVSPLVESPAGPRVGDAKRRSTPQCVPLRPTTLSRSGHSWRSDPSRLPPRSAFAAPFERWPRE